MPKQDQLDSMPSVDDKTAITWSFHRLPKLVYVPFFWRDEDKEDWRMTRHSGK